jgi:uncharacterized protein YbjT (DUF2867 family)
MAEIAETIGTATGKPVRYEPIDAETHRRGMEAAGLPRRAAISNRMSVLKRKAFGVSRRALSGLLEARRAIWCRRSG